MNKVKTILSIKMSFFIHVVKHENRNDRKIGGK